jgi:hypothetical protein
MIAINQRQSLRRAIVSAQTPEAASVLLTPGLKGVFTMFNVRYPRINGVLTHALDVMGKFLDRVEILGSNSDSQDFGDREALRLSLPT